MRFEKAQTKRSKRMRYSEICRMQKELDDLSQKKKKKISASKLYMVLMLAIALEIVFFIEFVTIRTGDTSCLYVLASIPVTTLVPSLMSYFKKSRIENSSGGIVYDMAMNNAEDNTQDNEEVITDEDSVSNGVG